MAAQGTSTQTNQNRGTGGGYFRDVNASLGALDLGSSSATADSGDINLGSVYSGASNSGSVGLVKTVLMFAAGLAAYVVYKRMK